MRARTLLAALAVLAAFVCVALPSAAGAGSGADAADTTAIAVRAVGPPRYVPADDGRTHLEYDLVITNGVPTDVTLKSVVARARGRKLLTLTGDDLAAHTHPLGGTDPTLTIPGASAVVTLVDLVLPGGGEVPKHLGNVIHYAVAPNPFNVGIGSHTVRAPRLPVERSKPIVIAPPVRGPGWVNSNGCCAPDFPHRSTFLPTNGRLLAIETFAIDWGRVRDGVLYRGGGTEVGNYVAYGAKVHSVADGKVVSAVDDRPEPPINNDPVAPGVNNPAQFGGNSAVVKIAPGKYAVYAHLQPGSVRVKAGQRVRTGQAIGLLGNSGNSSQPHLHFSIQDGPKPLSSTSLPFVFDRFRFQGRASVGPTGLPEIVVSGKPHRERRAYPLIQSVSDFSR
jgi:Peptidase family M23